MESVVSCLSSDWLNNVLQESDKEVEEDKNWPVLLLQTNARKFVWAMCAAFGVSHKGTPGSACLLLERYMCRHVKKFIQQAPDPEEWEHYKTSMSERFFLVLASCIQLAAKMNTALVSIPLTKVRSVLLDVGSDYSTKEIKESEYQVYRTLEFRLPMWTNLDTAEFLAKEVGLTKRSVLDVVSMVVDITDYYRNFLELSLQCFSEPNTSTSEPEMSSSKVTTPRVHLCAGAVLAAMRYACSPQDNAARRLARLTRTTDTHLVDIADVICSQILPPAHFIPSTNYIPPLKRRRVM